MDQRQTAARSRKKRDWGRPPQISQTARMGILPFAMAGMILAVRHDEIFDGEIWGVRPQSRFMNIIMIL